MPEHRISRTTIVAVLTATSAALIARAWLQVHLRDDGMQQALAANISYLVVPPILLMLLAPLWRGEKTFLKSLFRRQSLSWRIVLTAVAIGILLRLSWWSQLIAGVSFGFYGAGHPDAAAGPSFSFSFICTSPAAVALGILVMAILVPLIEEITHRGYVQTFLEQRGVVVSILLSAAVFAVIHDLSSWPFTFIAGIVLGVQYWATRSLWPSVITHATVNGLIQFDWHCRSTSWNPRPETIPLWYPGLVAALVFVICLACTILLLRKMATGARALRPGSPAL